MQPVMPVPVNIYQNNTYIIDLTQPHFNDEVRVEERQQVKENSPPYPFL